MGNNQIHIQIKNGSVKMHSDKPGNPLDILSALFTCQLGLLNDLVDRAPEDVRKQIRDDLYDKYNFGASHILEQFAPDLELHPNLTTEAILKAENDLLNQKFAQQTKAPDLKVSATAAQKVVN